MHPWLIEQMVVDHIEDQRRLAGVSTMRHATSAAAASSGAFSRHVGAFLIRAGQRLAGPEVQLTRTGDAASLASGC